MTSSVQGSNSSSSSGCVSGVGVGAWPAARDRAIGRSMTRSIAFIVLIDHTLLSVLCCFLVVVSRAALPDSTRVLIDYPKRVFLISGLVKAELSIASPQKVKYTSLINYWQYI